MLRVSALCAVFLISRRAVNLHLPLTSRLATTCQSWTACCWNSTPSSKAPPPSLLKVCPLTVSLQLFTISNDSNLQFAHSVNILFSSIEEAAPPLPASIVVQSIQENGVSVPSQDSPPLLEKPKRSAAVRGIEDVRPSVESLLDELESSVPSTR